MKQLVIRVAGVEYPCTPSMGAMLRFKQKTDKEVTEIDPGSLTELCTYLWCCVVSGAKRAGMEFGMDLMEFADAVSPDDMVAWQRAISEVTGDDEDADGQKKSLPASMN